MIIVNHQTPLSLLRINRGGNSGSNQRRRCSSGGSSSYNDVTRARPGSDPVFCCERAWAQPPGWSWSSERKKKCCMSSTSERLCNNPSLSSVTQFPLRRTQRGNEESSPVGILRPGLTLAYAFERVSLAAARRVHVCSLAPARRLEMAAVSAEAWLSM